MNGRLPASRRALLHYARREIHHAIPLFEEALEQGEDPRLHVNERWASWMLLGEFERAWKESDRVGASFHSGLHRADHILIRCLRGFGDAVQFLRFAPLLQQRARLSVQGPDHLLPLLQALPYFDHVFPFEDPLAQDCETWIECSDLPYFCRTSLDSIPDPLDLSRVAEREPSAEFLVGIAWNTGVWNQARSIPFHLLEPILMEHRIRFISLDRETEGWDLRSNPPPKRAPQLLETVQLMAKLNLVISADTLIAHLGGTLGIPTWTLLPYQSDWRWMLERTDSPWYPSMRLFRQCFPGDWSPLVQRVRSELRYVAGLR